MGFSVVVIVAVAVPVLQQHSLALTRVSNCTNTQDIYCRPSEHGDQNQTLLLYCCSLKPRQGNTRCTSAPVEREL